MKSKLYQKEGWFILEEENQFFGFDAENENEFDTEEKFSIYHKDNETVGNNINESAKDLNDFFDFVIKEEAEISENEVNAGIEKILAKTHTEEIKSEVAKTAKNKKVTFRVLFVAALLSALTFSCLYVVGSSHNINIENGFVTFAKDAVKIVFFGNEEENIDVKTLLEDLEAHGFKGIMLPQKLYTYRSSLPVYSASAEDIGSNDRVIFELNNNDITYSFKLEKTVSDSLISNYFSNLDNAETVVVDDVCIYVFEYDNGISAINFVNGDYSYFIQSDILLSDMIDTAQTILKTEE